MSVLSLLFFLNAQLMGIVHKVNGPWLLPDPYVDVFGFVMQERPWG